MNLKKPYLFTLTILASLFFVSCSNDDNGGETSEGVYLPSSIMWSATDGMYFTYDNQNRLILDIEVENEDGTTYRDETKYLYDNQGRLSFTVTSGDTTKFTYASNRVFSVEMEKGEVYSRDTLELGTKGELLKMYGIYNGSGNKYTETYEYDTSGNMVKSTRQSTWGGNHSSTTSVTTVTYDNKIGVFKHVNLPKWYYLSKNYFPYNTINNQLIATEDIGNYTYQCTIDYNDMGYPIKITETNDGESTPSTIAYIKR